MSGCFPEPEGLLELRNLFHDLVLFFLGSHLGIGLRLGSPIGPFRFDFAYKLRDPTESDAWRISAWKLKDFTFNFGIGEAF